MEVSMKLRWTVKEYADELEVSEGTIYNEAARGRIELKKIGSRTVITEPPAEYLKRLPKVEFASARTRHLSVGRSA
jgi:hypothetical protein